MARLLGREIKQELFDQWIGELFANEYNRTHASDYVAAAAPKQADSIDVILRSPTGKYPNVPLQITDSRPPDLVRREANKDSLRKILGKRLEKRGFNSHVIFFVAPELNAKKEVEPLCDKLERFICSNADPMIAKNQFDADDIWNNLHENPFSGLSIKRFDKLNRCDVNPATAYFVPSSVEVIQKALHRKRDKQYTDRNVLWLIIVTISLMSDIADVLEEMGPTQFDFEKAWLFAFGPNNTARIAEL